MQLALAVAPDAYLPGYDQARARVQELKTLEKSQEILLKLDMDPAPAIIIPKELTIAPEVFHRSGPYLAHADNGGLTLRVRSKFAKAVVNQAYGELPTVGPITKEVVGVAMADKFLADCGTRGTLGRLEAAYPRAGGRAPARPVTPAEANAAVGRCGLLMFGKMDAALRPYPLVAKAGDPFAVKVNPKSDNGFPVMGKWSDPGAAEKAMGLAKTLNEEVERVYRASGFDGVVAWVRSKESSHPHLMAFKGKAKADYYSGAKVEALKLRFYNALPRQIMLIMQTATQALEANATHILNSDSRSAIGVTLTHGGADELVTELDRQLRSDGYAYTHVGDDSWVVLKRADGRLMWLALDCSNFDLTQHGSVTAAVHRALAAELERIRPAAAAVWYALARERLVVTTGTLVRRWKHAGPSGMPLQSKVNDLLMDVLINRSLHDLTGVTTEAEADAVLQKVGADMGFVVRVEQYYASQAAGVREMLVDRPFLFIGYYFHNLGGDVLVHADLPRTFAQVPYPALKWTRAGNETWATEAMRLGSIALTMGIGTAAVQPAIDAFRRGAKALLEKVIADGKATVDTERLRWAVQENPWGPQVQPSLEGLMRALERDPLQLWKYGEPELPGLSTLIPLSWADQVDVDEQTKASEEGSNVNRPAAAPVKGVPIPPRAVPTHPVSLRNDGRPPPTAVWGPDKKPTPRPAETLGRRSRAANPRRDAFLAVEDSSSSTDSDWGLDYDVYE